MSSSHENSVNHRYMEVKVDVKLSNAVHSLFTYIHVLIH